MAEEMNTIISKIRESVEAQGLLFFYDQGAGVEMLLESADITSGDTVVFMYLLEDGRITDGIESVNVAMFFARLAPYDFDAEQNEAEQGEAKLAAAKYLNSLDKGNVLTYSDVATRYFYDELSINLTGIAINTIITETEGVTFCR